MSLINSYNSLLSGMTAASSQMNLAASNIANLSSQGYQALRANLTNTQGGGVAVASVTADTSPGDIDPDGIVESNVDPANEVVSMMLAKFAYTADAKVLKMDNDTTGTLLNVLG
jgi:flagellar basal body rod protein FlgG